MSFLLGIAVQSGVIVVAALGSRLLHTHLKLLLVAQGALIGIGAYAFAILGPLTGVLPAIATALAIGAVAGATITAASSRSVRDDYALLTFAVQLVWVAFVINARSLTGGALGLSGFPELPGPDLLGPHGPVLLLLALTITIQVWLSHRIDESAIRRFAAVAARGRELAQTLRVPALRVRLVLGAIAGGAMAIAGSAQAAHLSVVEPASFGTGLSVTILAVAVVSTVRPAVSLPLALFAVVVVPQLTRLLPSVGARAASVQMFVSGVLLCVCAALLIRRREPSDDEAV